MCDLSSQVGVIEDCAHGFFAVDSDDDVRGDYVIGSLTKFFPVYDGGVIASNEDFQLSLEPLSFGRELKSIYNVLHIAVRYGRLKWLGWIFSLVALIRSSRSNDEDDDSSENEKDEVNRISFEKYEKQVCKPASKICNYIVENSNFEQIVFKRKENYRYILDGLKNESNIELGLNCINDEFIPYMVVGRLLYPDLHHPALIKKGLPIWRWEHIYLSDCKIAKEYSKSIIQIPCHHQLSKAELSAIVSGIKQCLKES